jgi:FMN phosphatase YigB (HAD superfamily)
MVGDCPVRDVNAAKTLGLRTAWVRRSREWDASLPAPDAVVDDVADADTAIIMRQNIH